MMPQHEQRRPQMRRKLTAWTVHPQPTRQRSGSGYPHILQSLLELIFALDVEVIYVVLVLGP